MNLRRHQLWIGGQWKEGAQRLEVRSPFSRQVVSEADQASWDQMSFAIDESSKCLKKFSQSSRYIRARLLELMSREIDRLKDDFIELIVNEAGKPYSLAEVEVSRAVNTFAIASEEAKRYSGELIPVDRDLSGRAFLPALCLWRPRGVILGISPFNFPLNLAAHKVAPALAIGAPILLKPPPQAPGAATLLAKVFEESAMKVSDSQESIPLSALQVIHTANEVASRAVEDERISILSFTGSDKVGWMLRDRAKKKKVELELGGNAAVIVHEDAQLERAAARCAIGAYAYAGQVCISVQRIFVHEPVADKFKSLLISEIKKLGVGDPSKRDVVVGPLIDSSNADRIQKWIEEAKTEGAEILIEGRRDHNLVSPFLLSKVKSGLRISCQEVFGPVAILEVYKSFEEAIQMANDSAFGLQAGVFTDSTKRIQMAAENLNVGGVLINEIPTFRSDHLPYGGTKDSGLGREGIRSAMEEYSEKKTLIQLKST